MRASALLRVAAGSGAPPAESYAKSLAYASDLLRRQDHEAIWASYFYPAQLRPAYFALKALNVELAGLPDQVSNAMIGRMRFQWWKDSVRNMYEHKAPPHPLFTLLTNLPQRPFLSQYHFTRLVGARENNFLNPSFHSLQDLADYSAGTQASLLYLLLQATAAGAAPAHVSTSGPSALSPTRHAKPFEHVGHEHDPVEPGSVTGLVEADDLTLDHAASHLAVAITIATLLRSIPHHASKRVNVIPLEVAARHGLQEEALFRYGPDAPGFQDAVAQLAGIAEAELRTARECFRGTTGVPKRAVPVFLSATPTRSYLDRLSSAAVDYNPFSPQLRGRYWKLPFQVWGDARKGHF